MTHIQAAEAILTRIYVVRGVVDGLRENQGEIRDRKSACENKQPIVYNKDVNLISQSATSSFDEGGSGGAHGGSRKLPLVFTEHGSLMAAIRGLTMPEEPDHGRKIGFHSGNR